MTIWITLHLTTCMVQEPSSVLYLVVWIVVDLDPYSDKLPSQ
jgi:hypothetical protein